MTLHFSNILGKGNIESISQNFGFTTPTVLEQFIMDFEMYFHLSQKMKCITRGGMCLPFHTPEGVRRLSIDIDLITNKTVLETEKIMEEINDDNDELDIIKKEPKNPYPIPNLLSYNVNYQSCFNIPSKVKVDFQCDVNIDLPTQSIPLGFEILEFSLDFSPLVLSHGALISDKITTLALANIGLPTKKLKDVPKQIFDIATLLKLADQEEMHEAFETFKKLTDFKVQNYENDPKFTVREVIDSINESNQSFLDFSSTITINPIHESRFDSFKNRYLEQGGNQYKKTEHITDLLIVLLFSKLIYKNVEGQKTTEECAKEIVDHIKKIHELKSIDDQERRQITRDDLMKIMPTLPFNSKILNGPPLEQVHLIKEIFSL